MEPMASLRVVHKSGRLARRAGNNPKTIPVRQVNSAVNARMRKSGSGLMSRGLLSLGMSAINPRVMMTARMMPAAPPASDSTRLSIRSWRISCPREAPIESRTAISFCRAKARAISRFATLAQAMSNTRPTMHMSTTRAFEKLLRSCE